MQGDNEQALRIKKKAYLTLHESNLQHLINRHLRGCLQAISMHYHHISPGEENSAALLEGHHISGCTCQSCASAGQPQAMLAPGSSATQWALK